jgi:predicted anti-sigma-YlaC factor YlaD
MKTACKEIEQLIIMDLDRNLRDERLQVLDRHLDECSACRKTAGEYKDLFGLIKSDVLEDPGPAYWDEHVRSIEAAVKRKNRSFKLPEFWKIAASIAVPFLIMIGPLSYIIHPIAQPEAPLGNPALLMELSTLFGPPQEGGMYFTSL